MRNADYYTAHGVSPSLWRGCIGAWLPSLGNTWLSCPNQVGNGHSPAYGIGGSTNQDYWATNSSTRAGRQLVAHSNGTTSRWTAPFDISRVRQASISAWIGAVAYPSGTPTATASNRYIIAWHRLSDLTQTAWGLYQNSTNGAMWLDGAWRLSQTVWSQSLTHYALTWGPGRLMTVYANGVAIHSHTMAGAFPSIAGSATHVSLGNGFGGLGGCTWDDLRIYNRALSPAEVLELSQRPGIAYEIAPQYISYSLGMTPTISFTSRRTFSRVLP